jgi:general secretion pathway protein G
MPNITPSQRVRLNPMAGLTLIELILACGILLVLSSAAIPLARVTIIRNRESELHRDLREMRTAIDRYKDAADKNQIQTEVGSQGYPPDLQTLVDGVTVTTTGNTGGISASELAGASSTGQFGSIGTPGAGATGGTGGTSPGGSSTGASGQAMSTTSSKVRFLRSIPVDPMTGKTDWGLRAVGDDPDSDSWGGSNVFDVYSQSTGTASDGTKYSSW